MATHTEQKVDEDLYSRQLGAYGMETMGKLIKMKVLVIGLSGVGVEVCKNLALAGPRQISLLDETTVSQRDLGSNFFLKTSDVGQSRAAAILPRLKELNDYVTIDLADRAVLTGPQGTQAIAEFDCVICCNQDGAFAASFNEACRAAAEIKGSSIPFINCDVRGLAVRLFSDFGKKHSVIDATGENEKVGIVNNITKEGAKITVHLIDDKQNPFSNGDCVTFEEVEGMEQLNGSEPIEVKLAGRHALELLLDGSSFAAHVTGGLMKEVKVPQTVAFQSYDEHIASPFHPDIGCWNYCDFALMDNPGKLHVAMLAVHAFHAKTGDYPKLRNQEDAAQVVSIAKDLQASAEYMDGELDEDFTKTVAMLWQTEISPLAAFAGGFAAQEAVKSTGKFMPLRQFLFLDYHHMLPAVPAALPAGFDMDHRYSHMRAIFDEELFSKIQNATLFLVGAGALGCEFLKMFSLMGFCNGSGKLTVTDMDTIENSNLNRQFLFRKRHIGQMKSAVAAEAAHEMNDQFKVAPTQTRVGVETEDYFDDGFWSELDCVVNALDNVDSRLYVDRRCVWYGKPLLESGTLGTKCNSQVVMPHLTQSYGDSQDPPEESIPLCTLKNFPYQIDHCLQWSRDTFQGVFTDLPGELTLAKKNFAEYEEKVLSEGFPKLQTQRVSHAIDLLEFVKEPTKESAVARALNLFIRLHDHPIQQLLCNFPSDHITTEGVKFWSGTKREPTHMDLNADDLTHTKGFLFAASNLIANMAGFQGLKGLTEDDVLAIAKTLPYAQFQVDSGAKIQVSEGEEPTENSGGAEDEVERDHMIQKLKQMLSGVAVSIDPEEFEKDDDSNFHIDFVHACGNLRAQNYSIKTCARHQSKLIAGKIIPALATTTAMICGLVAMELIKTYTPGRKIEDFKNTFINIGIPMFVFSEPLEAMKHVDKDFDEVMGGAVIARPAGWTNWDKVHIDETGVSPERLKKILEEKFQVESGMMSVGSKMLWTEFNKKHQERFSVPIAETYATLLGQEGLGSQKYLSVECDCQDIETGTDVVLPPILIQL